MKKPRFKKLVTRNKDGLFINTEVFREAAAYFEEEGAYTYHPKDSWLYDKFWKEHARRSLQGYEVGGTYITGDHYFHLNFTRMKKAVKTEYGVVKQESFPDFWDSDYNYFHIRHIARYGAVPLHTEEGKMLMKLKYSDRKTFEKKAREYFKGLNLVYDLEDRYLHGGYDIVVGKARRKGYSHKAVTGATVNFTMRPKSITVFAASDTKFILPPKGLFQYFWNNLVWQRKHTAFAQPTEKVERYSEGIVRASMEDAKTGVEYGLMSEVHSYTYFPNTDVTRGMDIYDLNYEESGAAGPPGYLSDSLKASREALSAGAYKTGLITVWGTSGSLEKGTVDYASIFSNPKAHGMMAFKDIWNEETLDDRYEGFFHPVQWSMEGFIDENGNSFIKEAAAYEDSVRKSMLEDGASPETIVDRMQERPKNSDEAFFSGKDNLFPAYELRKQLRYIISNNIDEKWKNVELEISGDGVEVKEIPAGMCTPITSYWRVPTNKSGCVRILEMPDANAPYGTYKIGYDPVREDKGSSLVAITVYKKDYIGNTGLKNTVVAEFIGRKESTDEDNRIAYLLARLYNTKIMHENMVTNVRTYFRIKRILEYLAVQPTEVISKHVKNSTVNRVYGMHMTHELIVEGEKAIKRWLMTISDYDEDGKPVYNYMRLYSRRLIEELIAYDRKKNFDYISAFIMVMYDLERDMIMTGGDTESEERLRRRADKIVKIMHGQL